MSLTLRVLAGLLGGFLAGLVLARIPSAAPVIAALATVGAIFINLIRMTVFPLVVSILVASIGRAAASTELGGLAARAALIAVAMLLVTAAATTVIAQPILTRIHVDAPAVLSLARDRGAAGAAPSLTQWFVDIVPQNPIKSAADNAVLPVIVFSVLFALALARVDEPRRTPALRVIEAVADAMQRLVAGIIQLAPIGVFALAVPLASTLGVSAVGAVAAYIALVVSLTVIVMLVVVYPVGVLLGPMAARGFATFCAPAQAIAFASRTSLGALPVMIESAEAARLPPVVAGALVPLAASLFRVGAAVAQPVGVLFLARLYGITLTPVQLVAMVVTVVFATFAVPGIPFGSIIAMVPVLNAASVPVEGIAILLAVDTVPDMFRTTANVTGSMALAAALAGRRAGLKARTTPVERA